MTAEELIRTAFLFPEQLKQQIREIVASTDYVIFGPYYSEVGFETLCWIPFLYWIKEEFRVDPERVIAISRGGTRLWYRELAARYFEIFDYYSPAAFKEQNEARIARSGIQKQVAFDPFDQQILEKIKPSLGTGEYKVIHPAMMYNLFMLYWRHQRGLDVVLEHTRYKPFPASTAPIDFMALPDEYIAVKFYSNGNLPDTADNRAFALEMIDKIASRYPVVLLDSGFDLDDHATVLPEARKNIIRAQEFMQPENNLDRQTRLLARAKAFVGTCGGFGNIAAVYTVPALTFYSKTNYLFPLHLAHTLHVYSAFNSQPFWVCHTKDAGLLRLLL